MFKRKSICLSIANLSRVGGEERMCALLANMLAEKGHRVIIVNQNMYSWQKPAFELNREVSIFSMKRNPIEWLFCRLFPKAKYDIKKYHRILLRHKIDLVIDVDTEMTLYTAPAAKKTGIKIISWEHFCYQRFSSRNISKDILACLKSTTDLLVVLTKADQQCFIDLEGVPENKVCQIYNPSPIEMDIPTLHGCPKVLAMGRMEPEKGFDLLLQAWAIVENEINDWQLEIVGDGTAKNHLIELAKDLGLRNLIISPFTNDPSSKYREASLYAMSSRHEGFPLALLEAANMCLPIVSFDCNNGPREIIQDGVNGFLVPPCDIEAFAQRLIQLIKDEQLRLSLQSNMLESVSQFKREFIIEQWEQAINSLFN